jgi:hypothetical protein
VDEALPNESSKLHGNQSLCHESGAAIMNHNKVLSLLMLMLMVKSVDSDFY